MFTSKTALLSLAGMAFAAILLLSGCQGMLNNDTQTPASDPERTVDRVSLVLDWFPNTNHTGIYVAEAMGWFDEVGIDLEIIQPGDGVGATQMVAAERVDFGISHQEGVTLARAEEIPVLSIAAIIQHNSSAFAALADSGIEGVEDFAGKRYGGWGSPMEEAVLQGMMEEVGADFSEIEMTTIGEQMDFLSSIGRDNDFQWIFYAWDGIAAGQRGIDLNLVFLGEENEALDYYTPVIITSEQLIATNPDLVRRFLQEASRGYDYAIDSPEAAADILLEAAPELERELVIESQQWLADQYQAEAPRWGEQRSIVWDRFASWMEDNALLESMPDIESAYTNDFLPDEQD